MNPDHRDPVGDRVSSRVVIVDDDPDTLNLLARILRRENREIVTCDRGREAVRSFGETAPDVVVLDLDLPDIDGWEVLRRLREGGAQVKVVCVSGKRVSPDDIAQARSAGVDGFYTKPVEPEALRARIDSLIADDAQADAEKLEFADLERLAAPPDTAVTGASFGVKPLRLATPDDFQDLVTRYAEILNDALEQRAYRVERDLGRQLRALAGDLGRLTAGPRDVIDLHMAALRRLSDDSNPRRMQVYLHEGRMLVLELMGFLTQYYRVRAITVRR